MNKTCGFTKIALTTLLLSLNSFIFAEESQPQNNAKKRPMPPALGDKSTSYNNPNRFVVQGSFIYWQADVDGIDYALQTTTEVDYSSYTAFEPGNIDYTNSFKDKDLDFKWDPGFKAGIGLIFGDRDEWDMMLRWTWLQSKASRSVNSGPATDNTFLSTAPAIPEDIISSYQVPSFSSLILSSPATSSHANWRLHYNTVDLELGRNFFLTNNLTFRPHIGLRGAFLHQHTTVNYTLGSIDSFNISSLASDVPGTSSGTSQFKGSNEYDGVGLRGGFDTHWNFTRDFSVYGSLAGAVLFGQFDIDERFIAENTITPTGLAFVDQTITSNSTYKNKYRRTRSTVQAILGIMWHTSFYNDQQHLFISAGYEVNQWFQQNELRSIQFTNLSFQGLRTPGDLGLHGLTIDFVYDF